jgi:hypothetical protein
LVSVSVNKFSNCSARPGVPNRRSAQSALVRCRTVRRTIPLMDMPSPAIWRTRPDGRLAAQAGAADGACAHQSPCRVGHHAPDCGK